MNALIIEDHPVTALGLKLVLNKHLPSFFSEVATDGSSAVNFIETGTFDLVILDILLPKTDTHALVHKIKRLSEAKILVYSSVNEGVYAGKYLSAGANGFVSKGVSDDDFLLAVKTVLSGNVFVPSGVLQASEDRVILTSQNAFSTLSKRELEVLKHLLNGLNLKEISETMSLQPSTIATQKMRVLTKLGVGSMVEVYHLASQYGLFTNLNQEN